jgi:hypothetical protein
VKDPKMMPQEAGKSGEIHRSTEENGKKYKLLSKKYTCVVDSLCCDYLKIRYPEARAYRLGRNKPVVFLHGDSVRAVLMPIRTWVQLSPPTTSLKNQAMLKNIGNFVGVSLDRCN